MIRAPERLALARSADSTIGEHAGSLEICALEVGSPQHRSIEVGPGQIGIGQDGVGKIDGEQVCSGQFGSHQPSAAQVGSLEIDTAQVQTAEVGLAEIGWIAVAGRCKPGPDRLGIESGCRWGR